MKALASEIVRKLSKRLSWLAIQVRELTGASGHHGPIKPCLRWDINLKIGDMQLTKAEIAQTQIIVTTPEKWDVVTRNPAGKEGLAGVCFFKSNIPGF